EPLVADRVGGVLDHVRAEREGRAAAAVARAAGRVHREDELGPGPGQVEQVVAVDGPGQHAGRAHGSPSGCGLGVRVSAKESSRARAWGVTSAAGTSPPGSQRTRWRSASAGAHRAGLSPVEITTLGVPTAAATCDTPVSLQTRSRAPAITAAVAPRSVFPVRSSAGAAVAAATVRVR